MKPLFVTGSLVHGGAERHTITLANRLAERGHECHAAYVKNDPSQLARYRGMASITCLEAKRYFDPAALRALAALIREVKPSHIIGVNPYALLYAWLAKRIARSPAPLAATFHSTHPVGAKAWLQMLCYRPLFWSTDWLVCVCEAQRSYWRSRKLFARRTEVIHNGVDLEHWKPVSAEAAAALRRVLGFAASDLVVGVSGMLRPEKNHLQLVEAIGLLRRRGVPARALLIGDGEMRAAIEARAAALGLAGHVVITGAQQDVRPLVSACDAIALCSVSETFSLAALEAMALGRPVVHSDTGGAGEMLRHGREGYLFTVGDTRELVESLAALADPRLRARMGAQARRTVEERFSERVMVDRYEIRLQELAIARSKHGHLRKPARAH